uniref:Uncharacterized protein n=1 Tax=Hyaloperonospora arabidopsidis (strain Emoy2) TaxID=559515 RepID=M4BK11_HYAAE
METMDTLEQHQDEQQQTEVDGQDASERVGETAAAIPTVGETTLVTTVEEYQVSESFGAAEVPTVGETTSVTTVEETVTDTTVGETTSVTTVGEQQVPEGFVATDDSVRISAATVESITETIAASGSANVDVDDSVAATLTSSVDRESLETDNRVEEEIGAAKSSSETDAMDESTGTERDKDAERGIQAGRDLEQEGAELTITTMTTTVMTRLLVGVDEDSKVASEDECAENGVATELEAGATDSTGAVSGGAVDTTLNENEGEACQRVLKTSRDASSELSDDSMLSSQSCDAMSVVTETSVEEPMQGAGASKMTSPRRLSSMISREDGEVTTNTEAQRTDPAAEMELNLSLPVESIVHEFEAHEPASPQTHRTLSATRLDASGSSPVKDVVHRLEAHHEEDNALESLKIRTKRDFFSEKGRSISVSHEAEKYNSQMAQRAKEEVESKEQLKSPAMKQSPVSRKSSAMSSVRNMASRFEKKTDQSLDKLSFRTVRSFFPTEKSIHVGAEKQKYEALEKEMQTAKVAEEKGEKRMATNEAQKPRQHILADSKELTMEEHLAAETGGQGKPAMGDMPGTLTEPNETAVVKASSTSEAHPRRRTITAAESSDVRSIAHRFETKRANSVVTAPVRTIDTFIVADSEASVRVSAEKARYENQVKSSAPTKRTIDTFIVPKSETSVRVSAEKAKLETLEKPVRAIKRTIDAFIVPESETSVCVSAEKAKYEMPDKQTKATVRTIDNFIVPENEASIRVSAEKAKFETPDKLVKGASVRTIDTYIVPESDASVHVSAEKAKFESLEQRMQAAVPAVRTIDTFIVPESEVSIRVATEKAKLEAIEKQKKSELETQAVIEKQKLSRVTSWAMGRAESKKACQSAGETEAVDGVTVADQTKEIGVAEEMGAVSEAEGRKEIEVNEQTKEFEEAVDVNENEGTKEIVSKDPKLDSGAEATRLAEVTSPIEVVPETEVSLQSEMVVDSDNVKEGEDFGVAKETEVAVAEKISGIELIKEIGAASEANVAEEVASGSVVAGMDERVEADLEIEDAEEIEEANTGGTRTDVGEANAEEAEGVTKMEKKAIEESDLLEMATKVEETDDTDANMEPYVYVELGSTKVAENMEAADVTMETEVKGTEFTEEAKETEVTESAENREEAAVVDAALISEGNETLVVEKSETVTKTAEISEACETVKDVEKETTVSSVKALEVSPAFTGDATVTAEVEEVPHVTEEASFGDVGKEAREMATIKKAEDSEVVAMIEADETAEEEIAVQEAAIKDVQHVLSTQDSAVEFVVERQTFGDTVSTAQHAHWLSMPVSANPALARLHSVLSDHDPLTAYALYPSSSSSSSGSDEDEELSLPRVPASKPFAAT